jgi:rsbT co-antagonist protein RsbR
MTSRPPSDLGAPGEADPRGGEASTAELKAEIAALRARVAELELERAGPLAQRGGPHASLGSLMKPMMGSGAERLTEEALREKLHLLLSLIDNSPSLIFAKDPEGRYLLINQRYAQVVTRSREEIIGMTDGDILPAEVAAVVRVTDQEVMAGGKVVSVEENVPTPEGDQIWLSVKFPFYDTGGKLAGIGGIATGITALKRSEAERVALQEQVIAAQRAALQELSTPLIPIAEGVLAMPIVGVIDTMRAQEILEALLEGISKQRAHTAILDITGVRVVDTQVASALLGASRAARLLGARVLLTGISPEIAQTLVGLGADLSGVATLGTLQSGIAHALGR